MRGGLRQRSHTPVGRAVLLLSAVDNADLSVTGRRDQASWCVRYLISVWLPGRHTSTPSEESIKQSSSLYTHTSYYMNCKDPDVHFLAR